MKVKLEKTIDIVNGTTWYGVYADNDYIGGHTSIEQAEKLFDLTKKTKGKLKHTEVLAEEDIQDDYLSIY